MNEYQLHCIIGGNIRESSVYMASSDDEALALFGLRGETTDCELWCGDRRVAFIPKGRPPVLSKH